MPTSVEAGAARSPHPHAVELPRPTLRAAAPFIVMAVLGIGSIFIGGDGGQGVTASIETVVLFLVALGLLLVSLRRPQRSWIDPAGPWLFFAVIALARDASGGTASGLSTLVALPIVWLAMTGTRSDLVVSAVLTAVTLVVPIYLVGGDQYPMGEWRRALVWVAFAVVVAPAIQAIVRRLQVETLKERETSARLDAIMQGARLSALISTDLDGVVSSFSPGAEELLGYRSEEVVGHARPLLFHDSAEVLAVAEELGVSPEGVFPELARQNAPGRFWTYIRSDGARIHVQLVMTEIIDPDGAVLGYVGVAIDSTSAVEAEKALSVSEARWRALMDHLPDLTVLVLDADLTIHIVAGAGAGRHSLSQAVGKPLTSFSKPENMAVLGPLLEDALFDGREGVAELSATGSNGAEQEVWVTPLPAEDDGPRALILSRDVSKDRARERELRQALERAERLFADAPHGVAILTTWGTVVQANNALTSMVGPVAGGIVGRPLTSLGSASDQRLEAHLAEVWTIPTGRADAEWTVIGADGDEVSVALSSIVLRGDDLASDMVLVNVVDVSERRRYERRLTHLAEHDALTGLANRRRFDDELTRHLERCDRYGPTGAVLLLDLDHFKDVNDTLGHGAGDQLLIATAALLRRGLRGGDTVARLGGDEFAILLPEADRAEAETVASSVVARVREFTATFDGTYRRVTASVGVVTVQAAAAHTSDILALADMTMYDAKDEGRNSYVVLDEDSTRQPRTGARLQWKRRLEAALENGAFALHLQPILDLRTNTIRSAEVLLRLNDSDELVMPSRFVYIAERFGMMSAIDAWVIRQSVPLLARLRQIDPEFQLEVNLSGQSIGDSGIEQVVVESIAEHGVDAGALILEITETAAVADVDLAHQFAQRMTRLGSKFALDDFGAGFGSFYYLKHLLFDYVKIDGEFVSSCHTSGVDRSIVRSIVGIAHDLGKKAVAEFVSEPAILEIVRAEGVDFAQGYLIGRPVPFDDFVESFLTTSAGAPGAWM